MEYPGRTPVRVDEYPLLDGARHPFAVICPGGGYEKISDPLEGKDFARQLNGLGCAAFVVRCEHVSWLGVGHGVGLGEGLPCAGWLRRAAEFWRRAVL